MLHLVVAFAFLGTKTSALPTNDWTIIPGERVGPIRAGTTRSDLARFFGAGNVIDEDVTLSDTGPEPGTRVFGDRLDESLAVTWNDDKPAAHVQTIAFCQGEIGIASKCRWHTTEGVTFGIRLKALEMTNGKAFRMLGLGWDYGGAVTSWQGGKFEKWQTRCGHLALRLEPAAAEPSEERTSSIEQVEGDREFVSSEPGMQALDPEVCSMTFTFENCPNQPKAAALR